MVKEGVHGEGLCMTKRGHAWGRGEACDKGMCVARGSVHVRGGMRGKGAACVQERRPLKGGGTHPTGMHPCSNIKSLCCMR